MLLGRKAGVDLITFLNNKIELKLNFSLAFERGRATIREQVVEVIGYDFTGDGTKHKNQTPAVGPHTL